MGPELFVNPTHASHAIVIVNLSTALKINLNGLWKWYLDVHALGIALFLFVNKATPTDAREGRALSKQGTRQNKIATIPISLYKQEQRLVVNRCR